MKNKFFKNVVLLFPIIIGIVSFSSCGSKNEKTEAPPNMQVLDLSKYGKSFTMFVPDSVTARGSLMVTEQNYMLEVRDGKSFGLVIEEGDGNMDQLKTDLKGDDVNKFKRFLTEEPTMLVWESEITKPEFHLYAVVTVGTSKYVIKDLSSTDTEPYTEKDIKQMETSIKSIKEKMQEKS